MSQNTGVKSGAMQVEPSGRRSEPPARNSLVRAAHETKFRLLGTESGIPQSQTSTISIHVGCGADERWRRSSRDHATRPRMFSLS